MMYDVAIVDLMNQLHLLAQKLRVSYQIDHPSGGGTRVSITSEYAAECYVGVSENHVFLAYEKAVEFLHRLLDSYNGGDFTKLRKHNR